MHCVLQLLMLCLSGLSDTTVELLFIKLHAGTFAHCYKLDTMSFELNLHSRLEQIHLIKQHPPEVCEPALQNIQAHSTGCAYTCVLAAMQPH